MAARKNAELFVHEVLDRWLIPRDWLFAIDESYMEAEAAKGLLFRLPCHELIIIDSDLSIIIKIPIKNYPIIYRNLSLHFRCSVAKWFSGKGAPLSEGTYAPIRFCKAIG